MGSVPSYLYVVSCVGRDVEHILPPLPSPDLSPLPPPPLRTIDPFPSWPFQESPCDKQALMLYEYFPTG